MVEQNWIVYQYTIREGVKRNLENEMETVLSRVYPNEQCSFVKYHNPIYIGD